MKNQKNKLLIILLIAWSILASGFSYYSWNNNQRLKTINNSLLESLIEANNLAKNASTAYKVFGECVANQNTCDKNATENSLLELNEEKVRIEARIIEIQKKIRLLKVN